MILLDVYFNNLETGLPAAAFVCMIHFLLEVICHGFSLELYAIDRNTQTHRHTHMMRKSFASSYDKKSTVQFDRPPICLMRWIRIHTDGLPNFHDVHMSLAERASCHATFHYGLCSTRLLFVNDIRVPANNPVTNLVHEQNPQIYPKQ